MKVSPFLNIILNKDRDQISNTGMRSHNKSDNNDERIGIADLER